MTYERLSDEHAFAAILIMFLMAGESFACVSSAVAMPFRHNMVLVRGGRFVQFAKEDGRSVKVRIEPFYMDLHPVTNLEYMEFVKANPGWRRSRVKPIFADRNYLRNWSGDLIMGKKAAPNEPVTYISWYAARAYCTWRGKRLPTINEWDFAAKQATHREGDEAVLRNELKGWYSSTGGNIEIAASEAVSNKLFSLSAERLWEWVEDFSSVLQNGESDGSSSILSCGGASAGFTDPMNYTAFMRYAFLSGLKANYCLPNLGFRAVLSLNQNTKETK